jgi:HK97 family phage prohead protease
MSYETTGGMKSEAQKGLDWRSEFGRGGTEVGIARARDIVNGRNLSESTVKRMFSFFSRHEVDKQAEGFRPGEDGYPSNGRIAWALWGGDAGFSWSKKIVESLDDNRAQPDELEVGDFVSEEMSMDGEEMSMDGEEMSMDMEDDRLAEIEIVHRTFGMTTDDIINEGTREVQIVMSTENPVERGYGMEVLDHSKESVDMSWIATGRAPLLLDHDMSQQIGKITSVELDEAERKVRARVVFGRGPLAEEIFQDVKDGIRQNISVGYAINKMEREGTDTYRVKSWRPMEASIVSIPADSQSRVGRSAEAPPKPVIVSSTAEEKPMSEEINVEAVKAEARQAAMKDASAILELAAKHNRSDLGRVCCW